MDEDNKSRQPGPRGVGNVGIHCFALRINTATRELAKGPGHLGQRQGAARLVLVLEGSRCVLRGVTLCVERGHAVC